MTKRSLWSSVNFLACVRVLNLLLVNSSLAVNDFAVNGSIILLGPPLKEKNECKQRSL